MDFQTMGTSGKLISYKMTNIVEYEKEKKRKAKKAYYDKHREQILAYQKEYAQRKKKSIKEYQDLAVIGDNTVPLYKLSKKDVVQELKRIEQKRKVVLNEIEKFNNYIESLKIKV